MAKHKVTFSLPERQLANEDVIFHVYEDNSKFGRLRISKGAIEWLPRGHKRPYKMGWKRFEKVIKEYYGHD